MASQTSNGPAQPQSLANKTFTNLAEINNSVLNDDYIFKNFETWKIKGKTSLQGKWDFKAQVKDISKQITSELKVQFPYNRYWFWFGLRSAGDVKVHADFGNVTLGGKQFNIFANIKTSVRFDPGYYRIGANYFGNNYENNARFELNPQEEFSFTERVFSRRKNFFYGLVGSISLDDFSIKKFDGILGLDRDNFNFYFKFVGRPSQNAVELLQGIPSGNFTLTGIYTKDKNVYGAEVFTSPKETSIQVAAQRQINDDTSVKAKLNNSFELALALKYKISNQLNFIASTQLQLGKGTGAIDFSGANPVPLGLQFDLNI